MSKYDDDRVQPKEKERVPTLKATDWKTPHGQVKAQHSEAEDVSPRSKGEIPLTERHTEEIRRRIEEAKEKAARTSPVYDAPIPRPSTRPAVTSPMNPNLPTSSLSSVSPELLTELRKIIREEVEQLNKGEAQAGPGDNPERPPRPTSPVRSWTDTEDYVVSAAATASAVATASSLPKDGGGKRSNPTTGGPSPTTPQHKEPQRHSTVRFSNETKAAMSVPPRSGEDDNRKASPTKDARQMTAIDQKWGLLFDKEGESTKRMEHVVKGLANYIIEEFMPQHSIVITPEKMAAFYSLHRLDREVFPFAVLFKSKSKHLNEALESLYEDLGCQYFLTPADNRSRPSVPGLTPAGFKHWLVSFVQAYPDEEAKRLDKVVSALPIEADSLLDGKRERLPKQISRYLLPEKPVRKMQKMVDEAMRDFTQDINNSSTSQSNTDNNNSSGRPTPIVVTQEKRASMTTSSAQSSSSRYIPDAAFKESRADDGGMGQERDRRPTSTAASSSRDHDDSRRKSMPPPPGPGHLGRTNSLDTGGRPSQSSRTGHTSSSGGGLGRSATGSSSSSSRKNRSPTRNPHSQSVPSGLDRNDVGADRRSSVISAAAANVAAAVLRPSSRAAMPPAAHLASQSMSSSTPALDTSARETRSGDKRPSLDEAMPRSAVNLRDRSGLDSSSSSKHSKRRSMVLPDLKGPTWDDYLKGAAPKSSTSSFMKRAEPGYHSSG
ncbi:hypothetical protein DHEL01_v202721 [Diaporthe helianthi]|uniref:DUF7514 domain-containing protein n=1 Tax=Diaporthe helianthi TaxID=158607 RepID=A0A2P5I8R2_DIAHE|nr:hypothetical protein DHEL01_v202721 [Diaporthe helianthi]